MAGPTIRAICDDHAVEADRVDDPVGADHLDHEALPGRVVDALTAPQREDREEDHPGRDDAGRGDREEAERPGSPSAIWVTIRRRRFGNAVGEQAAPGAEEQHRQELQGGGEADGEAESVRLRISQIAATFCIQLPESEITWPAK